MKKAFTLIELLVVIAIIAILAAILFPVFAQAKQAAKKTQSLSNLKQNALGVILYTGDYDDVFPVGSPDDWEHIHLDSSGGRTQPVTGWVNSTRPYIKNLGILREPGDPMNNPLADSYVRGRLGAGGDAVYISYVSNGYMDQERSGSWPWGMYGVIGMAQNWMAGPKSQTTTGVTNVADTVLLTARHGSTDVWGPDSFIAGVSWWDWTGFAGLAPDGTRNGNAYTNGGTGVFNKNNKNGAVTANFADRAVFAFTDGHAASLNPASTNPDPTNRPQDNKWNSRR